MTHGEEEFQEAGDEGGQGGSFHPHGGGTQVAEDKHPVEEGVAHHGHRQDVKTQLGIGHAAVGADVHLGQAVKKEGEGHHFSVLGGQSHHRRLIAEQAHEPHREKVHDASKEKGEPAGDVHPDTDDPADGVVVPLAVKLADEDRRAALEAEDHELDDKDGNVGQGDGGHGGLSQQTHHKGVQQAQRVGDKILQNDGDGEGHHVLVEGLPPPHIGKHRSYLRYSRLPR